MMLAATAFSAHNAIMSKPSVKHYAWLSILAAVSTIFLKGFAWWMTGSVGLLSDALESVVNLAGAIMALAMITIAERPPDEHHAYGHGKAEYFSAGFEGLLILLAAVCIAYAAIERLLHPQLIAQIGVGIAVSVLASVVNLITAIVLRKAGRNYRSLPLEADADHLMTDVWTSAGVISGVGAVALSGWLWLDPIIALLVAANIVWTGWKLIYRSTQGLMDITLPPDEHALVVAVLSRYHDRGVAYHALRTRESGTRRFIEVHVLVPGQWTVQQGHEFTERLENEIRLVLPHSTVLTHLEPLEDPVSNEDILLDR